ncbi:hypothetical protein SEUCBS139899_009250 [Sporothrix eucalyptigena]
MSATSEPRPATPVRTSLSLSQKEKLSITELELKDATATSPANDEDGDLPAIDQKQLARTIRKVDLIILPTMTVILALCFIDRTNMGLAKVIGMGTDLNFKSNEYAISLLVFFPGYCLCVLPNNYILSKVPVRYWLTFLSFSFGILTLASGLVHTFNGLAAVRAFLGVCEAGVYPTIVVVMSVWYPKFYFGKRLTTVCAGASLLSALSGVLAYAFSHVHSPGYNGWRYIFIIEGSISAFVALCAFFVLDEYPRESKFLNTEQRDLTVRLLTQDREKESQEKLTISTILHTLQDWKVWIFAILYMLCVTGTYGLAYYIPLILNSQMGFTGAISQLLTTPPYFYGFILSVAVSSLSDHHKIRSPYIVGLELSVIMGMVLMRWGPNTGSQYLGLFFNLGSSLVLGPLIVVWAVDNASNHVKRSVTSGLQLSFGAIGGIIGSTVFRAQDAPYYTPGIIVVLCSSFVIAVVAAFFYFYFGKQNKLRKEAGLLLEGQQGFYYTL